MRLTAVTCAFLLLSSNTWAAEVLTAQGLGPVRIGMSLAQVEKALGKEESDCAIADRPDKKAWFMFFNYRLVRIDVEKRGIKSPEGAEVGMAQAALKKMYGKRAKISAHPYGGENDHYFRIPQKAKNRLLIFETWEGKVESFRIGTLDAAPLIEGCS